MVDDDGASLRQCTKCRKQLKSNASNFKQTRDGAYTKVCIQCLVTKASREREKRRTTSIRSSDASSSPEPQEDEDVDATDLGVLDHDIFLRSLNDLAGSEDILSLEARINLSNLLATGTPREAADAFAKQIWECLQYRFIYHSVYKSKRFPFSSFVYHCAQVDTRQHKSKKTGNGKRSRDKDCMDSFQCSGWIKVQIWDNDNIVLIKLQHKDKHIPYWLLDIPEETKEFVVSNLALSPTALWNAILEKNPLPQFSKKAIYNMWHEHSSRKWKRNNNEVESAKILIQEARQDTQEDLSNLYIVEPIALHTEEGFTALAFSLPAFLRQWGEKIREISLDSTWNTTGSNFEVYALLGEICGSGCPLGYLLIRTDKNEPGGKERFITEFLNHFKNTWDLKPAFTLTDKDASEINACRAVFPSAKHQLCFWHALRAIKTRLSVLRRRPKHYHVLDAKKEYDWIDESFVPLGQSKELNPDTYVATKAMPHITIRLGGVLQNKAPEPINTGTRLVVRLNGIIRSLVSLPEYPAQRDSTGNEADEGSTTDAEDCDDLEDQVDNFCAKSGGVEQDQEDGPDWMFEEGETMAKDPSYVFCPAPHRKQLLRLFTKHFCQHPLFPERANDGYWTAKEIQHNATYEMYKFCYNRGLREVWGYMWESWYSPKMWPLWAQSTSPRISRLRTTMNVENFWRQLKHEYLHNHPHPRLDHLVWVLISKVTPAYIARAEILGDNYRIGRPKSLNTYQRYFKSAWLRLLDKEVSETTYITNVRQCTCTCGRQKYDPHHLCKHLVQAIGRPSKRFWRQITRRRTMPLYRHVEFKPKDSDSVSSEDFDDTDESGGITDGDDREWDGDKSQLTGGQWCDLDFQGFSRGRSNKLKKRRNESNTDSSSGSVPQPPQKQARTSDNIIDLTQSSPPPPDISSDIEEISAPVEYPAIQYGSDDEHMADEYEADIRKRVEGYTKAAQLLSAQLACPTRSRIWMKSIVDRKLGADVMELVDDIRWLESGRTRGTTWAMGGSRRDQRRVQNTMGYQILPEGDH
ncbi:hypothetical protein H0H92_003572 [Tricholoma furcatifolium]|nr:hypothetical protein H0H92_003572 [Tricholoma furcatifolium]